MYVCLWPFHIDKFRVSWNFMKNFTEILNLSYTFLSFMFCSGRTTSSKKLFWISISHTWLKRLLHFNLGDKSKRGTWKIGSFCEIFHESLQKLWKIWNTFSVAGYATRMEKHQTATKPNFLHLVSRGIFFYKSQIFHMKFQNKIFQKIATLLPTTQRQTSTSICSNDALRDLGPPGPSFIQRSILKKHSFAACYAKILSWKLGKTFVKNTLFFYNILYCTTKRSHSYKNNK